MTHQMEENKTAALYPTIEAFNHATSKIICNNTRNINPDTARKNIQNPW